TDQPLTLDAVRALLASVDPGLATSDIVPIEGGWDFQTFAAGDWFFRFPKRADVVPHLRKEWRVLDALRPVSLPWHIPDHTVRAGPSEAFGWPWCGYRACPGKPAIGAPAPLVVSPEQVEVFTQALSRLSLAAPVWGPTEDERF